MIEYLQKEKEDLFKFWDLRVKHQELFDKWLHHAYQVVQHVAIDATKLRLALRTNPEEAMMILGKPNILAYKEEGGMPIIGFVLDENFIKNNEIALEHHSTFKFADHTSLERFVVRSWNDIPSTILAENMQQIESLYTKIKDSKLTEWNREARTTNNYLKHLVYSDLSALNELGSIHKIHFFNKSEFDVLQETRGLSYNKADKELKRKYDLLREAYVKNEHWAKQVKRDLFPNGVAKTVKKPTNQANNFDGYIWSRIYPSKEDFEAKWLAFTVGISVYHFEVKIDTVGLADSSTLRQKYFKERGEFNSSEIVCRYPLESVSGWLDLIKRTKQDIKNLMPQYRRLKNLESNLSTSTLSRMNEEKNFPLNRILYGPPGTGKTFKLQREYFGQFTVSESSLTKEQNLENLVADLTWWQTFAVALQDLGLSNSMTF